MEYSAAMVPCAVPRFVALLCAAVDAVSEGEELLSSLLFHHHLA